MRSNPWCWLAAGLLGAGAASLVVAATTIGGACSAAGDGAMAADGADLVLHDPAGQLLARWPLRNAQGQPGTVLAVCALPLRHSHVVVVQGWHELWEISHDPAAPPIYDGWVHDWRMGEGIARPGYLGIRRITLDQPWLAVFADAKVPWVIGAQTIGDGGADAVVLHLDVRRVLARWPLGSAGDAAERGGWLQGIALLGAWPPTFTLALPTAGGHGLLIDTRTWQQVGRPDGLLGTWPSGANAPLTR